MQKPQNQAKHTIQKLIVKLIKYLSQTAGRQKLCRLVQYFCRYLVTKYHQQYQHIIHNRQSISSRKQKAQSLMSACVMARKILRFGPSINCISTIILNIKSLLDGQVKQPLEIFILKTFSSFFIGMFFICDHYIWLFKMGLVNNDQLRIKMEFLSPLGWFLDCITCIIKNIIILVKKKKSLISNKQTIIDFIRVLGDLIISYSFVKPNTVNGKIVGALGTFTSIVGIYQNWP